MVLTALVIEGHDGVLRPPTYPLLFHIPTSFLLTSRRPVSGRKQQANIPPLPSRIVTAQVSVRSPRRMESYAQSITCRQRITHVALCMGMVEPQQNYHCSPGKRTIFKIRLPNVRTILRPMEHNIKRLIQKILKIETDCVWRRSRNKPKITTEKIYELLSTNHLQNNVTPWTG